LPDFTWQVNSFCDRLTSVPLQLPPLVDIEDAQDLGPALLTDWAIRVLTGVERATGKTPLLYTNRSFLNVRLQPERLTRWPLALARWTLEPAWPVEQPVFWQYTGNSRVPWATGPVDLQRAH
jgi:lysozyme